jgi:hypothetical protein
MRKSVPMVTLASGVIGLLIMAFLGLLQWRLISDHNRGIMHFDWSPYPEFLAMALNWWVPLSVLICGASVYLATQRMRSPALIVGWCLHATSTIGMIGLELWVFAVPLQGESSGVWWMLWNK